MTFSLRVVHYRLSELPDEIKHIFLKTHLLANVEEYRTKDSLSVGLFSVEEEITPLMKEGSVIWATETHGHKFFDKVSISDFDTIVPRIKKSKEIQKARTKDKAEVFTPTWLCNMQNNLGDDVRCGKNFFNTPDYENQTWQPTPSPLNFGENHAVDSAKYVIDRVIEMTCGEGPYLVSPYDTSTGESIPVRDEQGYFRRIGLLDRKLRVVAENVHKRKEWDNYVWGAYSSTYGYEWQGDNLLLARLNLLNTYREYFYDKWGELPTLEDMLPIAEVISFNIWQMDGLKAVAPESCTDDCVACKKKNGLHDGDLPVIKWGPRWENWRPFEEMMKEFLLGTQFPKK